MTIPVFEIGTQVTVKARFGVNPTSLQSKAAAGATSVTVYHVAGMANTDTLIFEAGHALREETAVISSISGRTITLSSALAFEHSAGSAVAELADPTTITLQHQTPDGVITTYSYALAEITRDSVGVYYKDITLDQEGEHVARFAGTGAVVIGAEHRFVVAESAFV